ncbi:MAG: hypothetical protein NT031_20915, partial [Planctomycetota bacterium]|nr:hypothetical protein [Planctomycetota bacterium]
MTTKTKRSGGLALGAALLAAALPAAWATARAGGEEEPAAPLTIAQLTARAQALRTQIGQGEQGVQALADEMAKLYAHASGAGGVPWDEWAPLVTPLGEYLSPEARAAMSESLARTDVSLAPHAKLKAFYECLLALDDEPAAVALTRRWVLASRGYKDLPLASLVELSLLTPRADDDGGAGRRVGEAILDKLLKDPQAAPSLPLARWCELAGRVGSALTAEQKAQWAEKLQMICTGADVSWEQLQLVLQAAGELGRADKSGYVTGWMAREPNQWQGLGADQLVALAGPLAGPGEPARAWREKIASQLEQTLLASPAAVRAQGNALGATIQAMAPGLSDAQKPRWRAKVREAFQAKASMTPADLQAVSDWLGLLGEAPANAHVADWTLAQTAWQGWASQDVRWLMGQLVGLGGGARDARSKVATHVTSTTISRPEGLATMPAAELGELVSAVAPALTTAQRREALEAMRAAFGGKAMSAGVLRSVEAVVRPLGEGAFVDFVAEWVGTQKSWQEFSLSDLNSLHELLKISPSARGPRASVAAQLTAAVLGDAKAMQGAPVEAVCQAAEGIARGAPSPVRERWTAALRARYGQAPLAGTDLARVRQTLATLGDVGGEEFLAGWVAV